VIWFHRREELKNFLNHLNNMQFTMKSESNACPPFLDMHRRPDASLENMVCKKASHTDLYHNAELQHHPAKQYSVLSTLVHQVRAICDQKSLQGEMEFLYSMFKQWL